MAETASETITIAAPPEQVWAIAADFERYPDWAKDVKDAVVRSRDDAGRARPRSSTAPRRSAAARTTRWATTTPTPHVLAWKMIHGDIMRTIDGAYTCRPPATAAPRCATT